MALPRAYWKGYLKLSLVTCPVALYPASSKSQKTRFHQINRKTGNRLRQQMVDEETGRAVDTDNKGRGYELSKGKYVEIEPDEIDAIEFENTHTIEIDKFVPEDEIDKRYYERPYYIVPNGKSGEEAFAVIRDAMKDKGRVALAGIVFANRQHILAVEPWGAAFVASSCSASAKFCAALALRIRRGPLARTRSANGFNSMRTSSDAFSTRPPYTARTIGAAPA